MNVAVVAHGLGVRGGLPFPLSTFIWAAAAIVAAVYLLLIVRWSRPLLRHAARGRTLATIPGWLRTGLQAIGYLMFLVALAAGWVGDNLVYNNLLPVTVYVTVWVGAQIVGGLVGDLWPALNPLVTMARLVDPNGDRADPPDWGHWPATIGIFVFLFYELAHPQGSLPRTLAVVLTTHLVVTVIAARSWGWRWIRDHEPFAALFATIGTMAPLFVADGRLRLRPPLSGLGELTVRAGTGAMLATVLGGSLWDGYSESPSGRELFESSTGWTLAAEETVGLLVTVVAVAAVFAAGAWWAGRVATIPVGEAWAMFTPALVPMVVGYTVAHYFQLFVDNIQVFVFRLADPFGAGWNLGGLADNVPSRIDATVTSWIQVVAVALGAVASLVVIHDRAVDRFRPGVATRAELGLVFVTIAFSGVGLWLLTTA